jgi:hypothetical protein
MDSNWECLDRSLATWLQVALCPAFLSGYKSGKSLVTRVVPITSRLYHGKLLLTPTLFVALFTKSVLLVEVIYHEVFYLGV